MNAQTKDTPAIVTEIAEYSQTAAALSDLRHRFHGIAFAVSTTKGMDEAKKARQEVKGYRTALEAKRKEIKAPALERCRLIDDEAKTITAALLELEEFQAKNDLHRMFAPGVIEGHRPRMTTAEKALLVLIYAASLAIVSMVIGWGAEEISRMDWQAVAQLLGVKR